MANKLVVAPAPHVQTSQSTARIMRDVVIALMPALAVSAVVFGVDVLRVTALSVAACVLFEYLIQKFLVRGASTIGNWSAVVTGVLLAFNLPASIPWWIVLIGAFVAIAIAKMTFGGLGKNPFNPALVGRVFLLIAYPVQMTSFPVPVNGSFDALSGATPLAAVKHGAAADVLGVQELLLGNMPGSLGEVAALALICGFVYLLWRRVITWQIPVTILGTMALFAFVVAAAKGGLSAGPVLWQFPLFHVLAGGALLGAIFMATDYSTSPMTVRGGVIFGVGIGEQRAWIGEQRFAGVAVFVDRAHPQRGDGIFRTVGTQEQHARAICNRAGRTWRTAGESQGTCFFTGELSNRICHIPNLSPFHISFPTDIHRTAWNRNDGDKPRIIYPLDGIKTEILHEIFAIKGLTNWRSALYRVGWVRIERDKHECSRPI